MEDLWKFMEARKENPDWVGIHISYKGEKVIHMGGQAIKYIDPRKRHILDKANTKKINLSDLEKRAFALGGDEVSIVRNTYKKIGDETTVYEEGDRLSRVLRYELNGLPSTEK